MKFEKPIIEMHQGIHVARDDKLPGGTKIRYIIKAFQNAKEVVYATPAYGGAQLAIAYAAKILNKKATIFVAHRRSPHQRTMEAKAAGAKVYQVKGGFLKVVQSKARSYCKINPEATYLEFGGESEATLKTIGETAAEIEKEYGPFDQIWTAAGSGVLTRGLQRGLTGDFYAVEVGKELTRKAAGRAEVIKAGMDFGKEIKASPPFPSCRNYDAKAWEKCKRYSKGRVLFWNVLGPSPTNYTNEEEFIQWYKNQRDEQPD